MNISGCHKTLACLVALCCLIACPDSTVAGQPKTAKLSPGEKKEYEIVQKRLRDHEGLLTAATWTLCHCADEKEIKRVEKTLNLLQAFADTNQMPKLVKAGGITSFKENVAILLRNKDPVVRGFSAILLAVVGDSGHKGEIAKLLQDKRGSPSGEEERLLYNWDRSRAAIALGLIGAKEFAPRLAVLIRSPDSADRTGAVLGLGYMGAKEYIGDIAKLLSDDEDEVQTAAMQALAELDAVAQAKDVAKLLTSDGDPSVSETACYALVRLNAKEQANQLAALLDDRFRKGNAAKALSLLGATEYTKDIARLIEDTEPTVRCDALIALGILDAKELVKNVAAHLHDDEAYVRAYAAVALLILGDQTQSKAIVEVIGADLEELKLPETVSHDPGTLAAYFSEHIKLHPVLAERQRQLTMRVVEGWERLNRSENKLQQRGAANGSQPIRSDTNGASPAAASRR